MLNEEHFMLCTNEMRFFFLIFCAWLSYRRFMNHRTDYIVKKETCTFEKLDLLDLVKWCAEYNLEKASH